MRHDFTAAAQRAFAEAAAWSIGECSNALEAPALLMGLLAESECRAALTLGRYGIDATAVRQRWPGLVRFPNRYPAWDLSAAHSAPEGGFPVRHIDPDVAASLADVARGLRSCGLPAELGTEHLLLGLAAANHEVAEWLRQYGLSPRTVEPGLVGRYGGIQGPSPPREPLPPIPLDDGLTREKSEGIEDSSVSREGGTGSEGTSASQVGRIGNPSYAGGTGSEDTSASQVGGIGNPSYAGRTGSEGTTASQAEQSPDSSCCPEPQERSRAMRVIDAAANRAREGLRVVEDYVRFVLDDKFLTGSLKSLRHELTALLLPLPAGERLAARETLADVGTQVTTAAERRRDRAADVLEANFARLQESLRSLEEFVKILDPVVSAGLKQLRYQTYTLHRAVEATRVGLERLQHARLYVLIDGRRTLEEFRELAQSLAASGVHVIQLRDKQLDDRALVGRARALREIAAGAGVVFVMNDRPDVAVLSRADGVHVGQEELSVKDARAIVGPDAIIGVSTHTIQQARKAVLDGANYIGVGPTFPSETKQFDRFPGVELLRAVAAEIRLPAFAVGGIRAENIPLVLQTGLQRVAVSAAIAGAEDPASAVGAMFAALTPKTDFGCRPPL